MKFLYIDKISKHDIFAHKNHNISTGSSKLYSCIDYNNIIILAGMAVI